MGRTPKSECMDGGIFWPKMSILPHLISAHLLPLNPSGKITRDKKQDRISGAPVRRFTPLILVRTLRFSSSSCNLLCRIFSGTQIFIR
ncbi:hypothetical protein L2E82_21497 [Cichorium intybus]|uniref:Uncharacterized protein n=1 Tax=Cichorium intybus TaxID=13427 RepID=A0ACB9DWE2_CICIN|nr:hypothetical protein L2E82_21497 [Cichorium intybus]